MAADIRLALSARLASLVLSPAMPIAWEGVEFDPPPVTGYLDVQLFRSATNRQFIGSADPHQRLGFLQVAVMVAPGDDGAGVMRADRIADAIVAHFPCDLRLGGVRITARPNVAGGFPDGAWWRLPISVPFEDRTV